MQYGGLPYSKMRLIGLIGIAVFFSHFAIDLEGDQLYAFSCPHSKMGTAKRMLV